MKGPPGRALLALLLAIVTLASGPHAVRAQAPGFSFTLASQPGLVAPADLRLGQRLLSAWLSWGPGRAWAIPPGHVVLTLVASDPLGSHHLRGGGAVVVVDPWAPPLAWLLPASHELAEAALNGNIDTWILPPPGTTRYFREICDPVSGYTLPFRYGGHPYDLSDWVTPAYFQPTGAPPYDAVGILAGPFTASSLGYQDTEEVGA